MPKRTSNIDASQSSFYGSVPPDARPETPQGYPPGLKLKESFQSHLEEVQKKLDDERRSEIKKKRTERRRKLLSSASQVNSTDSRLSEISWALRKKQFRKKLIVDTTPVPPSPLHTPKTATQNPESRLDSVD